MKKNKIPFQSIIILTQYFYPEPGAAQIRLGEIAKLMHSKGIKVRVITGMPNYPEGKIFKEYKNKFIKSEIWNNIPINRVWLYPASGKGSISRLLNYFSFTFTSFWLLFFSKSADLIFVEAQPITLAIPAYIVKLFKGIPYIYNTPDLQIEHAEEAGWLKSKTLLNVAKKMEKFLMRHSLSVSVVTKAYVEHFSKERNLPKSKFTFLPNGADIKELYPIDQNINYRKKMGVLDKEVKIFTFAGTNAPYQGLDTIIYAAKELKNRSDIIILLAGKGPERPKLISLAKSLRLENIIFIDSPFGEMRYLMSITYASLVVLKDNPTARMQRLSKVIPPLACKVPVIFAGYGESEQMINKFKCGMTIMPENPKLLASAIKNLAENINLRNEMGENGFLLVKKDLSWDSIINKWLEQLIKNEH